jgi:hypothetical protein
MPRGSCPRSPQAAQKWCKTRLTKKEIVLPLYGFEYSTTIDVSTMFVSLSVEALLVLSELL